MEWIPLVFFAFKFVVLGTGMFFAIKWHYDQGKKRKAQERRAVLRATGQVVALFMVSLVALGVVTFALMSKLGLSY